MLGLLMHVMAVAIFLVMEIVTVYHFCVSVVCCSGGKDRYKSLQPGCKVRFVTFFLRISLVCKNGGFIGKNLSWVDNGWKCMLLFLIVAV